MRDLILAGSYRRAWEIARTLRLGRSWRYVSDPRALRGTYGARLLLERDWVHGGNRSTAAVSALKCEIEHLVDLGVLTVEVVPVD